MKKILSMLLLAVAFVPMFAQDIIVTHESERIDVNVIEVSETEVKYKKSDNPNGPTFVLSTAKIASIIYKNGDVQTFKQQVQQKSGSVTSVREAADITFVPGQKIERSDQRNKYYYGNIELDETLYEDFLKLTCPDAYKQYSSGEGMIWAGSICGGLLIGMGLGLALPANKTGLIIAGGVVEAVGIISGITLICVGVNKEKKSLDTFNNHCSSALHSNVPMTLKVGLSSNGFGLALNF